MHLIIGPNEKPVHHLGDSLLCQRAELEEVCRDCSGSPSLSQTQRASPTVRK